jgi:hypothetical protein
MRTTDMQSVVSLVQEALYRVQGTFKHCIQTEDGYVVCACLGLPPFAHSVVASCQGAIEAALSVRADLLQMGIQSHAAIVTGSVWLGSVGNEARREYVVLGEPVALCNQMIRLASEKQPLLVDGYTFHANKTRYNFSALPITVRVHGQLRSYNLFAMCESKSTNKMRSSRQRTLGADVKRWLQQRRCHNTQEMLTSVRLSDATTQQLRDCYAELDEGGTGEIPINDLCHVLTLFYVDKSGGQDRSDDVREMLHEMDADGSGTISLDEFLATAARAQDMLEADHRSNAANVPLLVTAFAHRKQMNRKLGPSFGTTKLKKDPRKKHATIVEEAPPDAGAASASAERGGPSKPQPRTTYTNQQVVEEVDQIYAEAAAQKLLLGSPRAPLSPRSPRGALGTPRAPPLPAISPRLDRHPPSHAVMLAPRRGSVMPSSVLERGATGGSFRKAAQQAVAGSELCGGSHRRPKPGDASFSFSSNAAATGSFRRLAPRTQKESAVDVAPAYQLLSQGPQRSSAAMRLRQEARHEMQREGKNAGRTAQKLRLHAFRCLRDTLTLHHEAVKAPPGTVRRDFATAETVRQPHSPAASSGGPSFRLPVPGRVVCSEG